MDIHADIATNLPNVDKSNHYSKQNIDLNDEKINNNSYSLNLKVTSNCLNYYKLFKGWVKKKSKENKKKLRLSKVQLY